MAHGLLVCLGRQGVILRWPSWPAVQGGESCGGSVGVYWEGRRGWVGLRTRHSIG